MPIRVEVRDGNVGRSMMQLKRTLIREGLFKEIKKRKYHCKPSLAKRLKREAAAKQRNKDRNRAISAAIKAEF
jgi:small subunit ribosomal protein S21